MLTHTISAVLLEISYLATGIILCIIGQRLLIQGIEAKTKIDGSIAGKWSLFTTSPGVVFGICGLAIIIYAIITPSVFEEETRANINNTDVATTAQDTTYQMTTRISSRLLMDQNVSLLRSKMTMYSLNYGLTHDQIEIAQEISQVPKASMLEPWSETYQRFGEMLRKNPKALTKIIDDPQYGWIFTDQCKTESLVTLVEIEMRKL